MEEKQFNSAYQEFGNSIFRYIYFKVSEYELAKDLTADTFVRFWKVLNREEIIQVKAFLFSIAYGIVVDYYRKKKHKKVSLHLISEQLLGFIDTNEEKLFKKQELEQVLIQLKKLKKEYQDVLLLYYIEELTIKEIAFVFNKNENNIRVILHRGLKILKGLV